MSKLRVYATKKHKKNTTTMEWENAQWLALVSVGDEFVSFRFIASPASNTLPQYSLNGISVCKF